MADGPIFLVGAMGSGTTLLRLILDSHEDIAIPQETGFMRAYDAFKYAPFKASGRNWTKRLGWKPAERDELLRELFDTLFMRYAEKHGKRRWGEKTPIHTWHVDDMARLFPEAQFIGVIRHPSASVASNMRRFNLRLVRTAVHWARYTAEIARQASLHRDRFVLVRYEDLVLDPEAMLRELLDWLGEPWSDVVLSHHDVQGERKGRKRVEGRSRRDEPIDPSRIATWRTAMPERRQRWLAARLARQAEFFGYAMDAPAPVAPLAPDGGAVLRGADVDARIDAFADLDLRTQREIPLAEREHDPREIMLITREQYAELTAARPATTLRARVARSLPVPVRRPLARLVRGARRRAKPA